MLSKKFTKAKELVQNLFSNKMDVLRSPQVMNYFDIMPIDILIPIFNNLELTDVMKCENISPQTREAAANYYRRRFSKFHFNLSSLASLAHCNQYQDSLLSFAEEMFRVIGPYVQQLFINYPSFCANWVRPFSKMIRKYCRNLTIVSIIGIPNHRIKMVNTKNITKLAVFDCLFVKQFPPMTSSKLSILYYRSRGSTTDIVKLIREHPYIRKIIVEINCITTDQLRSIASLRFLKSLTVQVYQTDIENEMQVQKSIDFSVFIENLKIMPRLAHVELILPFYMRLSREIVNTSVKSLRRMCMVDLTTKSNYLEPEHIQTLRADLDGLNGVHCYINFEQNDLLLSLLTCAQLEVLRLSLGGRLEGFDNHQIVGVLAALVQVARTETCCLRLVVLDASYTEPLDVKHLPAIDEFLQKAKQLESLHLRNCTAGLIKRRASLQTENVFVSFE